jgi:hypothetical protein
VRAGNQNRIYQELHFAIVFVSNLSKSICLGERKERVFINELENDVICKSGKGGTNALADVVTAKSDTMSSHNVVVCV